MPVGTTVAATLVALALTATPVTPKPPIIEQATGRCVHGVWTVDPASVVLPEVVNGRWLDDSSAGFSPTRTYDPITPGEYTFGFITAEGDYVLTEPRRKDTYRLEPGVAYYTVVIAGLAPRDCSKKGKN